jgi:hypothetical protein
MCSLLDRGKCLRWDTHARTRARAHTHTRGFAVGSVASQKGKMCVGVGVWRVWRVWVCVVGGWVGVCVCVFVCVCDYTHTYTYTYVYAYTCVFVFD